MRAQAVIVVLTLGACSFGGSGQSAAELSAEAAKLAAEAAEVAKAEAALQPISVADQLVEVTPAGRAVITGQTATPAVAADDPAGYPLPLKAACQTISNPTASQASGIQFLGGQGTTELETGANRVRHNVALEFQLTREAGDAPVSLLYGQPEKNQLVKASGEKIVSNVAYDKRDGTMAIAAVEAECQKKGLR